MAGVRGRTAAMAQALRTSPKFSPCPHRLLDAPTLKKIEKKLAKAAKTAPFIISAATGDGIEPLLDSILDAVTGEKASEVEDEPEGTWSPL